MKSAFLLMALGLILTTPATANADEGGLISSLTSKLGITEEQAMAGAGSVFDYAKENLSADDWSKIASGIPGMDSLLAAVPEGTADSLMGQAGSMLGGSAGGLASLAGAFEGLGLDADTVSQFLPIVYDYVGGASGEDAMNLLKGLF